MAGEIKGRVTLRRILNQGYTPIRYRAENRTWHGWIYREGPKYYQAQLIGRGPCRIPKSERRWIVKLSHPPGRWTEVEGKRVWEDLHEQLP